MYLGISRFLEEISIGFKKIELLYPSNSDDVDGQLFL